LSSFQRVLSRVPWAYTFRRLLIAIPTMLAIITMAFLMMRAAPGGPFDGERKLPAATEQAIAAKFGFDKPLHEQYLNYVGGVLQGDFGPSYKTLGKSVNSLIADGLPISLTIGSLAMALGLGLGTCSACSQVPQVR
jgi:oligopeptide transport system permease protein